MTPEEISQILFPEDSSPHIYPDEIFDLQSNNYKDNIVRLISLYVLKYGRPSEGFGFLYYRIYQPNDLIPNLPISRQPFEKAIEILRERFDWYCRPGYFHVPK